MIYQFGRIPSCPSARKPVCLTCPWRDSDAASFGSLWVSSPIFSLLASVMRGTCKHSPFLYGSWPLSGSACPETTRPHTLRRTCCINYRNRPLLCFWGHRGFSWTSASLCSGLLMLASPKEGSGLFPSPTSFLQSFLLWSLSSTILCFGHTNAKAVQQATK